MDKEKTKFMKEDKVVYADINNKRNKNVIQQAIDSCPENGTVVVGEGKWESGPLHLKSNMTLYIEKNCNIVFSGKFEDYLPVVFTRWEGVECYNYSPLIYANNCENITIKGNGTFNGNGEKWWKWKKLQQNAADKLCHAESEKIVVEKRVFGTENDALRPSFIQLINCKNILFDGFTVKNGPQWTIHPVYCDNVVARNLNIETEGPNTDGFNPDSCSNVLIENCRFSTGDDCIAINSGLNEDGWRVSKPCRNVEIRNCVFDEGHASIAIGSGMSGGVSEIWVHNCFVRSTERGIRIKSMRGRGGYVKNIKFENIDIEGTREEAIQVSMNYGSSTAVPVSDKVPVFSDILFKNITVKSSQKGIELKGLSDSILERVVMENVKYGDMPLKVENVSLFTRDK